MNKFQITKVFAIFILAAAVAWIFSVRIYYIYRDIFVQHDELSNYDLMIPFITYFNHGQYQVIPDVSYPFDYSLIRIDNAENANDNTELVSHITKYILIEDNLYIVGQTASNEDSVTSEDYMVINMKTGETSSFGLIEDMSEEDRAVFEMELGNKCLVDRTCYGKGITRSWWNIFD